MLAKSGLMDKIGKENQFVFLQDAHLYHQKLAGKIIENITISDSALQAGSQLP